VTGPILLIVRLSFLPSSGTAKVEDRMTLGTVLSPLATSVMRCGRRYSPRSFVHTFVLRILKVTNIYVGNLSFRATEDEVRSAFGAHGNVSSVNIIMDRETGRSRGFAFVEMPNAEEARAAIEKTNGKEIAGRAVTVNEARPRTERPRGGGGGGGGGGRYNDDRGGRRSYSRGDDY
jgi:RNA recognition motif-containing protein